MYTYYASSVADMPTIDEVFYLFKISKRFLSN